MYDVSSLSDRDNPPDNMIHVYVYVYVYVCVCVYVYVYVYLLSTCCAKHAD